MANVSIPKEGAKRERPWREIAKEVVNATESDRVAQLSQELIEALDKETITPHSEQLKQQKLGLKKSA